MTWVGAAALNGDEVADDFVLVFGEPVKDRFSDGSAGAVVRGADQSARSLEDDARVVVAGQAGEHREGFGQFPGEPPDRRGSLAPHALGGVCSRQSFELGEEDGRTKLPGAAGG